MPVSPLGATRLFGFATLAFAGLVLGLWQNSLPAQDRDENAKPAVGKKDDAEQKTSAKNPFPKRIPAPDLDGGIEWLNTDGEISLKDLRGKVVVLDFWTFCCINCMHVLPDLAYLEKKFDKELVVIGVHSAKFDNERETGNIRKAILRYEIAHPVVNDAKMTIWRKFEVNSWPSLVLIDPEGYYCGHVSGEGNRAIMEEAIGKLIAYHRGKKTLNEEPIHFNLERNKLKPGPLKFPGKLLADVPGNRLFISDSNHNRIVVSSLDGQLLDVIGTGEIGWEDGGYDTAQFDHPQGMCLVDDVLYVADTENHLLRTVDLKQKTVDTLAGNGKQASFRSPKAGKLKELSLNSPWDLYAVDGILYIAMAGPHQMWAYKIGSEEIGAYAGSGREDIRNGTLESSALAQPSGVTSDGTSLFVVDSEGSSVRRIVTKNADHDPKEAVATIVGTSDLPNGRCLFEFGDVDGVGEQARLQHPLGIVYHDGKLFVADSYNHKIKLVDPAEQSSETWLGSGKAGDGLSPVQLAEPAGLTVAGETLFVADTNNHRILAVNLKTKAAKEFIVDGLKPPTISEEQASAEKSPAGAITVDKQVVKSGKSLRVEIGFELPEQHKLNAEFPVKYTLTAADQTLVSADELGKKKGLVIKGDKAVVEIPLAEKTGSAELTLSLTFGYCKDTDNGACKVTTSTWNIPVEVKSDAKAGAVSLKAIVK